MHQLAALVSANRTTHAFDIDPISNSIAYAANNAIKIFLSHMESYFLFGHTSRVTGLRFLKTGTYPNQRTTGLVSISADKTAIIWRWNDSGKLEFDVRVEGHDEGIVCLGVARGDYIRTDEEYFATGSSDNTVRIYKTTRGRCECTQIVSVGSKYALALELGYLPSTQVLIMFAAGTDKLITLYVHQGKEFTRALSLQGHTAWIHSLSLHTFRSEATESFNTGDLLLASGSQDKYIRIWRVSQSIAEDRQDNNFGDDLIRQLEDNDDE